MPCQPANALMNPPGPAAQARVGPQRTRRGRQRLPQRRLPRRRPGAAYRRHHRSGTQLPGRRIRRVPRYGYQTPRVMLIAARSFSGTTPDANNCTASYPCYVPAIYSLEILFPVINLRQVAYRLPSGATRDRPTLRPAPDRPAHSGRQRRLRPVHLSAEPLLPQQRQAAPHPRIPPRPQRHHPHYQPTQRRRRPTPRLLT